MRTKKQRKRWLETRLPGPEERRLVVVTGARQTGKTTLIGIEVKSRPEAHSSDLRSFPPVAKALEDRWLGGLVVHRGRRLHCLDEGRRVWAVPIHRLLV